MNLICYKFFYILYSRLLASLEIYSVYIHINIILSWQNVQRHCTEKVNMGNTAEFNSREGEIMMYWIRRQL